jgi:hypothetical protein
MYWLEPVFQTGSPKTGPVLYALNRASLSFEPVLNQSITAVRSGCEPVRAHVRTGCEWLDLRKYRIE